MNEISSLKHLQDDTLIANLKSLAHQERKTLTQILYYLKEIECRRLYLARGHSSLFSMLTTEMGYSESAAGRRIQAMRLLKDVPQVAAKLSSGTLSLSVASQVQGYLRNVDQQRREENIPKLNQTEKIDLIQELEGSSSRDCEKKLLAKGGKQALPREKTRAITPQQSLIQFVVDEALLKKLNKLKALTSHQNPEGKYELLIDQLAEWGLDKLDPERREQRRLKRVERKEKTENQKLMECGGEIVKGGSGSTTKHKPLKSTARLPTSGVKPNHGRRIPQGLRDQVWLRDKGQCQFIHPKTGGLCGSNYLLQIDHRYPFSLGGEHSLENLRLRCFNHNKYHAREVLAGEIPKTLSS